MYTQCPDCTSVFEISPEHLGAAGGMVRCGVCNTTFNALRRLTEKPPETKSAELSDDTAPKTSKSAKSGEIAHTAPTQTDAFDDDAALDEFADRDEAPEPRAVDDEATLAADEFRGVEEAPSKERSVDESLEDTRAKDEPTEAERETTEPEEAHSDSRGVEPDDLPQDAEAETGEDLSEDQNHADNESNVEDLMVAEFVDSIAEDDAPVDVDAAEEELNELLEDLDEDGDDVDGDETETENPDDLFSTSQIIDEWDIEEGEHDLEALLADETLLDKHGAEEASENVGSDGEAQPDSDSPETEEDDLEAAASATEDEHIDDSLHDETSDETDIQTQEDIELPEDTLEDDSELVVSDVSNMEELHDLDELEEFELLDNLIEEVPDDTTELLEEDYDEQEVTDYLNKALNEEDDAEEEFVDEPEQIEDDETNDGDDSDVPNQPDLVDDNEVDEELSDAEAAEETQIEEEPSDVENTEEGETNEKLSDEETAEEDDTEEEDYDDESKRNSGVVLTEGVDGQFEEDYDDEDLKDLGNYLSPKKSLGRRLGEGLLVIALIGLLGGQYVHHNRTELATHPKFGVHVRNAYSALGKELQADWKVADYRVARHTIVPKDDNDEVLMARATVVNNSDHERPLPLVRLQLKNRWGDSIYGRVFTPQEYTSGAAPAVLAGKGKLEVSLDLVHPSPNEEIGYSFDVCLDTPKGPDCGSVQIFTE